MLLINYLGGGIRVREILKTKVRREIKGVVLKYISSRVR